MEGKSGKRERKRRKKEKKGREKEKRGKGTIGKKKERKVRR